MFMSSSRLLSRAKLQWRDPLIGQSVLVGLIAAALDAGLRGPVAWNLAASLGNEPITLAWTDLDLLLGQRVALSMILGQSVMLGFVFVHIMALVLIRYLVKRRIPAVLLTLAVWTLFTGPGSAEAVFWGLVMSGIFLFVLLRWGVVALVVGRIAGNLIWQARPADWGAWHAEGSVLILVALGLLAVYGAWAAVGGRVAKAVD
jgi:hypothetical protein